MLTKSVEWLTEKQYSARDFMVLVSNRYPVATAPTTEAKSNAERSRGIGAQKAVLVEVNTSGIDGGELNFADFLAFRAWNLIHSITVPAYEYRRALEGGMLTLANAYIAQGPQPEQVAVAKSSFYSANRGLAFEEREGFNEFK